VRDVTQQHLSKQILKERNRELKQSNKELAYFNQVASHDLQEPLRKVQTLISLILERESPALSESGKDYFFRIQASVSRMRTLIDDLLLFSRTNKIDKTFELTDLNLILKNTLFEMSNRLKRKMQLFNLTSYRN
jgi:light-regulated signal transduction histidine kinase (bacteriophytochrome)